MDLSFHVPTTNTQFVGDENRPPAQVSFSIVNLITFKCSFEFDSKAIRSVEMFSLSQFVIYLFLFAGFLG